MSCESEVKISKNEFPWGVNVCSLRHSRTGNIMPGILPADTGGLVVSYEQNREYEAEKLLEYIALKLLQSVPKGGMDIHAVDFNIKNRFPNLSELKSTQLYKIYHSEKSAIDYLDEIQEVSIHRHHNLLSDNVKTISEFNKKSDYPEKYSLIIVNINDFPDSRDSVVKLKKLLEHCFEAGFYVLFLYNSNKNNINDNDEKESFTRDILKKYPHILLNDDIRSNQVGFSEHEYSTKNLLSICSVHSLITEYPEGIDAALDTLSKEIIVKEKDAESKDKNFLSIPIGTTEDGRHIVTFDLGQRSGNINTLIVGQPGSGKTTLLNNIIVSIAEKYTSDEIRLYLMDYKEGTEFQVFDTHPNCEKIFLDNSDIDSAKKLIQQFSDLMKERGQIFRDSQVPDMDRYNEKYPDKQLYRLILVVDEVQQLFSSNGNASIQGMISDVARRGRAFGIHFIFSTQSLADYSMDRDIRNQIQLKIAFRITPLDCQQIFESRQEVAATLSNYKLIMNNTLSGDISSNVICRCDPPVDLSRISIVLKNLEPRLILKPIVCASDKAGTEAANKRNDFDLSESGFSLDTRPFEKAESNENKVGEKLSGDLDDGGDELYERAFGEN